MQTKDYIVSMLVEQLQKNGDTLIDKTECLKLLETPPQQKLGDYAFPCFLLAKELQKSPVVIAEELVNKLNVVIAGQTNSIIQGAEAIGPYVNFFLNRQFVGQKIVDTILKEREQYGNLQIGNGEHITIDLSSPNIAKPFSMGHLRSTVIGNALANIVEKVGYKAVKINHLGDWGTQFGKLITAYHLWGKEEKVKASTIKELLQLYVRFHEEAEANPQLEDEGRLWFKRLEEGDEEALHLWKWFRDESLKEFKKIYDLLGIEFDSYNGEAFYNDKMDVVVEELSNKGLLVESNGAMVVPLEEYDLSPCLIKKSDGATLYATRDLAAALYRKNEYNFVKSLYVVGNEQSLHFKQMFYVLKKMGCEWADNLYHIPFGMILKDGKKMSTRKGKLVLLEEVLQEAIQLAEQNIEEKNPQLANKEEIAKMVGVGAVIFHDLKNDRLNDIEFSLEKMLTFEGETAPYLQYTYARASSILRKAKNSASENVEFGNVFEDERAWGIIKLLMKFGEVIENAYEHFDPSRIAKYLIDVAQSFNKYYAQVRILEDDHGLANRLQIVESTTIVIKEGLRLLGIQAPEEM